MADHAWDIDTDLLLQGFAREARSRGARIVTDAAVSAIRRTGDGWAVTSKAGAFEARMIVNAAGAWVDRIAAMATELRKLGAQVDEGADFLRVTPPARWTAGRIHTYDDHRVAMCFSLAAFNADRVPVRIEDPKCVAKTFPDYFETLFDVASADTDRIPVICIDGPTASGKGTLASRVAAQLGYHYLDSGALYRVTAHAALQAGLTLGATDEAQIAQLARSLPVRFEGEQVLLSNVDVTDAIRSEQGGMNASKVSVLPAVREALVQLQHSFRMNLRDATFGHTKSVTNF